MSSYFLSLAGLFGFLGVATGAFGAHGLKARIAEDALQTWTLGSRYVMVHAAVLLGVAILSEIRPSQTLTISGWCFVVGMTVFGGTLWVLSVTGIKWLGAITPIGGVALLAGWALLIWTGLPGRDAL